MSKNRKKAKENKDSAPSSEASADQVSVSLDAAEPTEPEAPVVVPEPQDAAPEPQPVVEPKLEPKPSVAIKFSSSDPDLTIMHLEDAAVMMINGYKTSWLPGIRAKATAMGHKELATKREWRGVFLAYGGVNILQ
jgi:hypothetical protein